MISPPFPNNEKERQIAVEKYQLLDTLPEDDYDSITSLISNICEVPISLITLLDKERNFLKSHYGVPFSESPRNLSFCGHAINSEDAITIVEDARQDTRFIGNPLVSDYKAVFYAGVPLVDSDGYKLGTLCVYDHKPRKLTEIQLNALMEMSKQVINLFEQRYQNLQLVKLQDKLQKRNEDLQKFASRVSHDLKSPLANIISITELLQSNVKNSLDEESLQYLEYLKISSNSLKDYIDGILRFYKNDDLLKTSKETLEIDGFIEEIKNITDTEHVVDLSYKSDINEICTYKSALMRILINLIINAIKYNSKPRVVIEIHISEDTDFYYFSVIDNSDGIPEEHIDTIFDLFSVVGIPDRNGNMGTGIGLASVKKIVNNLGGKISVTSVVEKGSTFSFSISKFLNNS